MQLTVYTDYSLRVLLYLALKPEGELSTISDIAESYGVSRNHLVKVVHNLAKLGYVGSQRGKNGGLFLACDPTRVTIAEVVRHTEPNFDMVECFKSEDDNGCSITAVCTLKGMLGEALGAFMKVLGSYTLSDVLKKPGEVTHLVNILNIVNR